MFKLPVLIAGGLLLSIPLAAQAPPSAEGPAVAVWVGAAISTFNPDYGCTSDSPFQCWGNQLFGIGPYATTSAFLFGRIGAEGEARFLHWRGPGGLTESSYLAGPTIRLFRYKDLRFNAKVLVGEARLNVSSGVGTGNYFAFAPGGTVEYPLRRRVSLRFGYEHQIWPSFQGRVIGHQHQGLTPNGFSLGVSYAILR